MSGKASSPGLFETLREVGVAMLTIAHSRAALAGIELAEERERLLHRGLLAVLAVLAFGLAAAVFTLLMVVIFWDTWRVQVLVIFLCLYAALGFWCVARMRAEAARAPILLERTLAELEHDLDTLGAMTKPLALAVRKELLLARASLERAALVRALDRFGQAREPLERVARLASGFGGGATPSGLLGLFDYARSHPYLGAAASLLASGLRRTAAGRWAIRGLAVGAAVMGVVWMLGRKGNRD